MNNAKDKDNKIAIILYDLSAAFNTIEPQVLIETRKIYGFDSIKYQRRIP